MPSRVGRPLGAAVMLVESRPQCVRVCWQPHVSNGTLERNVSLMSLGCTPLRLGRWWPVRLPLHDASGGLLAILIDAPIHDIQPVRNDAAFLTVADFLKLQAMINRIVICIPVHETREYGLHVSALGRTTAQSGLLVFAK